MVLCKYVFNLLMVEKVRSLVALVAGSGCVLCIALVLLNCNSCLHVVVVGVYCVLRKNYYITIVNNFNERKRWSGKCLVCRAGSASPAPWLNESRDGSAFAIVGHQLTS